MHGNLIDLTGQKFNSWTVLSRASNGKVGQPRWFCRCICGRTGILYGGHLRSGHSKSCRSCQISRKNFKHGQASPRETGLYRVWADMIQRCENPNDKGYKYYGGREISICSEWRKDFTAFRRWALAHGYKEGLTIDKIDNDGNYEPKNCQWLARSENILKAWHIDGSHGKKYLKVS